MTNLFLNPVYLTKILENSAVSIIENKYVKTLGCGLSIEDHYKKLHGIFLGETSVTDDDGRVHTTYRVKMNDMDTLPEEYKSLVNPADGILTFSNGTFFFITKHP